MLPSFQKDLSEKSERNLKEMNIAEFEQVKQMTYLEYCDYLQNKYGIGRADYMTKSFNKNPKVSRTSEGLFAHHKAEDKMIMLSTKAFAQMCPFEWQQKENIIYCDYLEHLLLHVLICKYPSPDKVPMADVGIGGVTNFLVPELNDLYSGWAPSQTWRINCQNAIKDDLDVYLAILKLFIEYLQTERDFHDKAILHTSANESYGTWSKSNNRSLYSKFNKLWK